MDFTVPDRMAANKAKLILKSNATRFITPKFFKVDTDNMTLEQNENEAARLETPAYIKSFFGQPVFDIIDIPSFSYIRPIDGVKIVTASQALGTALIEINQSKLIVNTQIQGRAGTVKEYIGLGDYDITITGAMISEHSNVPPRQQMQYLYDVLIAPVPIQVYSNFLDYVRIYTLVVKDFKFNQIEGTRNAVGYTIQCLSDEPFEIQYQEDQTVNKYKTTASF